LTEHTITVQINDVTKTIPAGIHIIPDFVLHEGDNYIHVTGPFPALATFYYQEYSL